MLSLGLQTWEDHLWARACALFEDRVDLLLARYGGFWSAGGIRSLTQGQSGEMEDQPAEPEDDEAAFEEQIEAVLKELETVKVNSRCVVLKFPIIDSCWSPVPSALSCRSHLEL